MIGDERERGAALLAVLLLVAVMAALAAVALERSQMAARLAGNVASMEQARAYATAAEALAVTRINDLYAADQAKTTLQGGWLGRENVLPLPEGGVAIARIIDGGNCFNLNSVGRGSDPRALTVEPRAVVQFATLMGLIGIPQRDAALIAAALGDWLDADSNASRGGAEDGAYQQRDPPYRAANTMIADASELRAIEGMTPEYYALLRPLVCALPGTQPAMINVNTLLPEQAPLLAMIAPNRLSIEDALRIIASRPDTGWTSIADFADLPAIAGLDLDGDALRQIEVRTRWFWLDLDVRLGEVDLAQSALIDARIVPGRIVARRYQRPDEEPLPTNEGS